MDRSFWLFGINLNICIIWIPISLILFISRANKSRLAMAPGIWMVEVANAAKSLLVFHMLQGVARTKLLVEILEERWLEILV